MEVSYVSNYFNFSAVGDSFAGVKRPGRKADYQTPTSAEAENTWIHTSTPPYVFMA
jgi:hypothetical protein